VSVVIPCYNYGRYLPSAVESVLTQTGVDVEVIVVDDCSTDGSQEVARSLAASEPRVRLLLHDRNLGHIRTYNDGLALVTGDYVVLLSADDLLAPNSLARSTALLENRPDVGLVYGCAVDFSETPPPPRTDVRSWSIWSGQAWLARICSRGANTIVNPEAIMRRSLMRELGGYDQGLPHTADMELWMRAAARANVGRINGPDQAFYRVHDSNMHATDFRGLLIDMAERKKTFDGFFISEGGEHPGPRGQALLQRAHKALALDALRVACSALDGSGSHDGSEASDFAEFALECWPPLEKSIRWWPYAARHRRRVSEVRRQYAAAMYSLRWKVRWRRWRRFGT
jgi:glycosyltransferase involved in cell wall biosynthesis